ncbi:MAG: NAD(P)-dependent oxidoreductase [Anaerolineae bacterium]|uniref:NAD-dependent epimerase/dehydratase family protein n=1 Tax=Candidatus Flexifilum breve TaxID=3140694 RepID=UPI001AC0EA5F|nr:NAD(P)-dependent oxidoreductase [Chloroflexota bacterium]MBK9747074.1 NAD(P)-dependent oxidoreductase [Chloroflexota bacterium]MBN8638914.1 NAD(P)-dependent oxidoreductase [Anaerolineae bacterium]
MKILLAGATGAVGRRLLPLLVAAGHEVTGTTRHADKLDYIAVTGARPILMNALERSSVYSALQTAQPDVVAHQLTDLVARDFAANSRLRVEGTRNLVDAARACGVERMIAQSIAWVCGAGERPSTEDDPLDLDAPEPRCRTVLAVKALEDAVTEVPNGVVLRYGLLYGPGTWYARDGLTTEQVRSGALTATDAIASFVHVEDAVQAALAALTWSPGVYNIVDDEPAAGTDWLPYYASLIGAPPPPIEHRRDAWERGVSNAKAHAAGWNPTYPSWRVGFQQELGATG